MRIEAKRNAVFPMCIKHADDWKPLECSQQNRSQEYIKKFVRVFDYQWFKVQKSLSFCRFSLQKSQFHNNLILISPQALILLITFGLAGVGLYGSLHMVIEFAPEKLLPGKG